MVTFSPSFCCSQSAEASTTKETKAVMTTIAPHSSVRLGSVAAIIMMVAMVEGPAMAGIASGTMKGSPSGVSPKTPSFEGKTMRMAMSMTITEPPIVSAASERPSAVMKA